MRKIIDYLSWGFVMLFAAPSILIMGSWSSLPGDFMYPIKIGLERMLLFAVKPSYAAEASLNVKYTERRFSETKVLLANDQSGKGLSYLKQQVIATKAVIDRAPNPETRRQLSRKYVATLEAVSLELSNERKQIVAASPPNSAPLEPTRRPTVPHSTVTPASRIPTGIQTPTSTPFEPTNTPISYPSPTSTPEDNTNNNDVITEIDTTQDGIQEIINDLNKNSLSQDQLENLQNNTELNNQNNQNNQNQEQNNAQDFINNNNNKSNNDHWQGFH